MHHITDGVFFEFIKRSGWQIWGLRLGALDNPEVEAFCRSFPQAWVVGKTAIKLEGLKLRFEHVGFSVAEAGENAVPAGFITRDITADEAIGINDLLAHRCLYAGTTYHIDLVATPIKGFELRLSAPH